MFATVVVNSVVPITLKIAFHAIVCGVPLSLIRIVNFCPSLGEPVGALNVVPTANAVTSYKSVVFTAIVILELEVVEFTLGTIPNLLLNVVQSALDNAPRLVADAVGTFNVITGVVVLVATDELKSVPVVPNVKADTFVTVPTDTEPPRLIAELLIVILELLNALLGIALKLVPANVGDAPDAID